MSVEFSDGDIRATIDPAQLLVSDAAALFERLNNTGGEGPGGVAAIAVPERVHDGVSALDINPIEIVHDAHRLLLEQREARLGTAMNAPRDKRTRSLYRRLHGLNDVVTEILREALAPQIDLERFHIDSWSELRTTRGNDYSTLHPDLGTANSYFGEVHAGGPRHVIKYKPACDDPESTEALYRLGAMPDNLVVLYRNRNWQYRFNKQAGGILHAANAGPKAAEGRTVGLGRVSLHRIR